MTEGNVIGRVEKQRNPPHSKRMKFYSRGKTKQPATLVAIRTRNSKDGVQRPPHTQREGETEGLSKYGVERRRGGEPEDANKNRWCRRA